MYSQNNEDEIVTAYFKGKKGTLLEIGANDGVTFSNSLLLIRQGWMADLVEPSPKAFNLLSELHKNSNLTRVHNCAISYDDGMFTLHESGAHVPNGTDISLVSTIDEQGKKKWTNVEFTPVEVAGVTFKSFMEISCSHHFDFISIDAEGCDWEILQQIDLNAVGCSCLCIEWNSDAMLAKQYTDYCNKFGLKEMHRNAENIIFCR